MDWFWWALIILGVVFIGWLIYIIYLLLSVFNVGASFFTSYLKSWDE